MISDEVFLSAWAELGPCYFPTVQTGFFDNSGLHRSFMDEDLKKSGLKGIHINGICPPALTLNGAESGYVIPYVGPDGKWAAGPDGKLAMYRIKLKRPAASKDSRYIQPTSDDLIKNGYGPVNPYIHPLTFKLPGDYLVCAEGEKKTVSILRYLGIPAFGIGGYQMWRNPDGTGSVHPWIRQILQRRGFKKVLIVPDGDLLRYDICNGYGTFAHTLRQEGFDVEICKPAGKIDDLFVEWGNNAKDCFAAIPRIPIDELVQSKSFLVARYNLAHSKNDKGVIQVPETTSNVMALLENHPAFPKIWRNTDDNRVYIGEEQATPDLSEMQIANYFQHNLTFAKVTHKMVYSCVQALAKANQRSPFLDYVKNLKWDGIPRLTSWLARSWHVPQSTYLEEVSLKWLVSACARMDKPGTKVDWMLIVVGPQGVGKTSMPSVMFNGNSLTLYGESNDKDLHMKLHSALVIGFDELDSFGKRETSFLKAMITTAQDHFRPPYGASVEVFDRRCTLYGCGNRHEFLQSDPSGYRRYAIVSVDQKLDFQMLEEERDQLWAEAWNLYTSGNVAFWEVTGASEEARKYVAPSALEEMITDYLEKCKANATNVKDGAVYVRYSVMTDTLQIRNANPREVAAILRAQGGDQKKCRGPQGGNVTNWWVIPL